MVQKHGGSDNLVVFSRKLPQVRKQTNKQTNRVVLLTGSILTETSAGVMTFVRLLQQLREAET